LAWPYDLLPDAAATLDVRLPVDDFRGADELAALRAPSADALEQANRGYWVDRLDHGGLRVALPGRVAHLFDLFRVCRATLLVLADDGEIHPGPTIYDSFWVRDSSVEGIASALAGDGELAARQFGDHYPARFSLGSDRIGEVSTRGFFGGEHERNDREWDSNGEALWAVGRYDRIAGAARAFGARVYAPFVVEGARWIRDNRDRYGLLHAGWSAEHIGDKDKPHFWDDFWGLAGLYEAARLSERLGAPETAELWAAFDDLKRATADAIRWVLARQRASGHWETFIPTGPGDPGRLDSTMVGTLAYFHPCRLYMGAKLGEDIDRAARATLDTIWSHFAAEEAGFRHDSAWNAYGAYLTLQLAHAFLLVGDVKRMDRCLTWSVRAGYARAGRADDPGLPGQVALGAWNEQHCYPVATDFARVPDRWWYMGDIPHGWAAAEFNLLLRDVLFFEAGEDDDPHVYLAPGVMPHWVRERRAGRRRGRADRLRRPVRLHAAPRRAGPCRHDRHHAGPARPGAVRLSVPLRDGDVGHGGWRRRAGRRRGGRARRRYGASRDPLPVTRRRRVCRPCARLGSRGAKRTGFGTGAGAARARAGTGGSVPGCTVGRLRAAVGSSQPSMPISGGPSRWHVHPRTASRPRSTS
jgi:hypothetical protein